MGLFVFEIIGLTGIEVGVIPSLCVFKLILPSGKREYSGGMRFLMIFLWRESGALLASILRSWVKSCFIVSMSCPAISFVATGWYKLVLAKWASLRSM